MTTVVCMGFCLMYAGVTFVCVLMCVVYVKFLNAVCFVHLSVISFVREYSEGVRGCDFCLICDGMWMFVSSCRY